MCRTIERNRWRHDVVVGRKIVCPITHGTCRKTATAASKISLRELRVASVTWAWINVCCRQRVAVVECPIHQAVSVNIFVARIANKVAVHVELLIVCYAGTYVEAATWCILGLLQKSRLH